MEALLREKGLEGSAAAVDWQEYAQQQYDKLADGVRGALDMNAVYRILERGV